MISEGPTVRIALASTRRAHRIEHRTGPHMASLDTASEDADETNVLLTDPLPECARAPTNSHVAPRIWHIPRPHRDHPSLTDPLPPSNSPAQTPRVLR